MDMQNCTLCPRLCHVDRTKNYGVCHASDKVEIAYPYINGKNRSYPEPMEQARFFSLIVI